MVVLGTPQLQKGCTVAVEQGALLEGSTLAPEATVGPGPGLTAGAEREAGAGGRAFSSGTKTTAAQRRPGSPGPVAAHPH